MTPDKDRFKSGLVGQWLTKADEDLGVAQRLLDDQQPFLSAIAFHAQQAAEKYLKAYLVHHQMEFPKTHDIKELLLLIARIEKALAARLGEAVILSPFASDTRYPAGEEDLSLKTVSQAVEIANSVKDAIKKALKDG